MVSGPRYTGRFAPSPTGPLHAGSLVAALASWLDAQAHGGRWLVRIEDVDHPRCVPGAAEHILAQLAACGLLPDETPVWQSRRSALYAAALARLVGSGWAYPCGCSRREIDAALAAQGVPHQRFGERIYPGTCRRGLRGLPARAVRLRTLHGGSADVLIDWCDRRLGPQRQNLTHEIGDFVLHRADGLWAYQLAVVVDDADQAITDVVRGADLVDNTARQIHLQRLLGAGLPTWATPRYLHSPLVLGADGRKLSKQNGALPFASESRLDVLTALAAAGQTLGLSPAPAATVPDWLASATAHWRARWGPPVSESRAGAVA